MNSALEQLNDVTAMIGEAREAVAEGAFVDLSEIQARVQNVCVEIQNAQPDNAAAVERQIMMMIDDLNALADDLEKQQKELGSEVIRHAVHKTSKPPTRGDS